jgi:hypothetical protein
MNDAWTLRPQQAQEKGHGQQDCQEKADQEKMKKGTRVSWMYQGKRTFGVVTGSGGKRASIKTRSGGTVTRVGSDDDPVIRIKSESTGNAVLKKKSELRAAPKRK